MVLFTPNEKIELRNVILALSIELMDKNRIYTTTLRSTLIYTFAYLVDVEICRWLRLTPSLTLGYVLHVSGGGSSVSGSPTTGYLGGMGGGGGGHTPGSSSPGSEMSPQHNESPPAPSWPGEMKHHPHPHAPPHTHHHPHTPGHHPPPPPPPPHHAGYMPQYSWYQADPNPGLLT